MDRNNVVAWLSSLSDMQFVEFFYEAVSGRDTSEIEGERGHLVVANIGNMPHEEREIVFLAVPDREAYSGEWADDSPICQTGQCNQCGSRVRSVAKHAICPICEAKVYCT